MGEAVTLAYVHDAEVAHSWHTSYIDLLGWDIAHHQRVVEGGWLGMRCGTGGLIAARNDTVKRFLAERGNDWLWWIDTDMGFAPDTVDRLLHAAHATDRPVVGALCFAHHETGLDGMGGYRAQPLPTLYQWTKVGPDKEGFTSWFDYPRDSLVRVAATGAACILIHRSVFEKIAADTGGSHWYTPLVNPSTGEPLSEDLSFCARATAVGVPIHVHTGVKTTHLKRVWLGEDDYDRVVAAQFAAESLQDGDDSDADVEPVGPAMPA